MFKKLAVTGATAALLFGSAIPSFAALNVGVGNGNIIQANVGAVSNHIGASANSGRNVNLSFGGGAQLVNTGTATAANQVQTQLNVNQVTCGCAAANSNFGLLNGNIAQVNLGHVSNHINARANSGENVNVGGLVMVQGTKTGKAEAGSVVSTFVNTNVVGPTVSD